ncbi:ABC transporter permease [Xanthomonas translucens pv. phlei]|uniref:ABC transporter permease n=2 Tax=Xanthomonas translucens group TaxID=3390202 RepID=A0A0K2ZFU9_9XANT|nr:ABC transporter permease [Xanthomonas translucens pv. phlei]
MTSANWLPVRQTVPDSHLRMLTTRAASADLFAMFGMRFLYGSGWRRGDDAQRAQVVVLTRTLNDTLFGGADSVGKTLTIATRPFRVIGVIDNWDAQPRFYDLNSERSLDRDGFGNRSGLKSLLQCTRRDDRKFL